MSKIKEGENYNHRNTRSILRVIWQHTAREEVPHEGSHSTGSWASNSPVTDGKHIYAYFGSHGLYCYDMQGRLLWESSVMIQNAIPSPVTAKGMVYVMSGYMGNALQAIRFSEAKGNIAGSKAIVWKLDKDTPYIPSPLLYDDILYFMSGMGGNSISCVNAGTGKVYYSNQRLKGLGSLIYASPVLADGKIYITSRNGSAAVIKQGPQFEVLATNNLDDCFSASPVIVGNELYLRGDKYLYCITEK